MTNQSAAHAVCPPPNRLRAQRLIAVANELLAVARELETTPEAGGSEPKSRMFGRDFAASDDPIWVELARQAYRDRRQRVAIFDDATLFGEPAWDILLDLFIAAKERKRVSVSSACIASAVPPTTGLRWVAALEAKNLIVREVDPDDARRYFLRLTTDTYLKMVEFFKSCSRLVRSDEGIRSFGPKIHHTLDDVEFMLGQGY